MRKDDLKSLVTQMYVNLLDQIEAEEEATIEQVAGYLKDASNTIAGIDENKLHSIDEARLRFTNTYKEIAKESLSSYQNTNVKFEQIAQMHEQTVNECENLINLPALTERFNEIQLHMSDEVKKANTIIMQLVEQVKILEETSNLDSLTKVFNRRALTTYLEEICSRENVNYELHLLILDVDDFKQINDTYGHVAGDKILIFLANILKKTLRDGDKIFRYGGEEFVIVLNRIDTIHCKNITDRLLELVRRNKLIYQGRSIQVTMSISATNYRLNDVPDSLLSRADKALYKAKNSGKKSNVFGSIKMEFNYFDLVAAIIILLLGLKGIINGFFKEAFGLIGIIGGIFIASRVGNEVGQYLSDLVFKFENSAAVNFTGFLVTLAAFWLIMIVSGALFKKLSSMSGLGPVDKLLGFIFGSSKFFLIAAVIAHAAYNIKAIKSTLDPVMQNSILFPILIETGAVIMKIDPIEISDDINATITQGSNEIDNKVQELTQTKTSQLVDEVKNALEQNNTKLPSESEKK